ncbi:unnamed protein product [Rangifer tarandus platyrhynchus]|uniref:Uncharacterized protein n=1 Tax=Rangifer tarandus platyrhynchus TaxID=3082113 RepID=A0AC59ZKU8_RANTA
MPTLHLQQFIKYTSGFPVLVLISAEASFWFFQRDDQMANNNYNLTFCSVCSEATRVLAYSSAHSEARRKACACLLTLARGGWRPRSQRGGGAGLHQPAPTRAS